MRCKISVPFTALVTFLCCHVACAEISEFPGKIATTTIRVAKGKEGQLCISLPDGTEKVSGSDTYHYYAFRISAEVFAKQTFTRQWGKPCSPDGEAMKCGDTPNGEFVGESFELETEGRFSRHLCWTFTNRSARALDARLVAHFTLREVKNGFVLYDQFGKDGAPILTAVQAACVCQSDGNTLVAYFARELRPSALFFAKRGDVVEIAAMGKGIEFGHPSGCRSEIKEGTFRVKITHINQFEQPAAYKTVIRGTLSKQDLTDERWIFGAP